MSEINAKGAKIMGPPDFPAGGRLPGTTQVVLENFYRQGKEEKNYCRTPGEDGKSRSLECCHALHISLFFDGTSGLAGKRRVRRAFSCKARPLKEGILK